MRNIVNISLPVELNTEVERVIEREHFASKSEFFRYLFRLWLENGLASDLEESRKQMRLGKKHLLNSLKSFR